MSDVKSVYGVVGAANSFTADVIQTPTSTIGIATISAIDVPTGFSSIRSSNEFFPGTISVDNLVRFTDTSVPDPIIARVVSVGTTHVVIAGVTTVTGITSSKLPSSTLQVTDLTYLTTKLGDSSDNTLYTRLAKNNISNISIDKTNITVRKTYTNLVIDSTKNYQQSSMLVKILSSYLLTKKDTHFSDLTEHMKFSLLINLNLVLMRRNFRFIT